MGEQKVKWLTWMILMQIGVFLLLVLTILGLLDTKQLRELTQRPPTIQSHPPHFRVPLQQLLRRQPEVQGQRKVGYGVAGQKLEFCFPERGACACVLS